MYNCIYLDDIRKPIDNKFILLKSYNEFISFFNENYLKIDYISFDNDLGDDLEGYDILKYIIDFALDNDFELPQINVHSNNIVAIKNIESMVNNYYKFINSNKKCSKIIHDFVV
jgi:hypothetical protein